MTTYGRTNAVTAGGGTPTPTQTKEVQATAFPTVVTPDSGYALSQATVTAPANLSAENIKAGVSIAGVTGSFQGTEVQVPDERGAFWLRMARHYGAIYNTATSKWEFTSLKKEYWPDNTPDPNNNNTMYLILQEYGLYNVCLRSIELPGKEAALSTNGLVYIPNHYFDKLNYAITSSGLCTITGDNDAVYSFGSSALASSYITDIPQVHYANNTIPISLCANAGMGSITVPEGITRIDNGAFEDVKAANRVGVSELVITLPSTLTYIKGASYYNTFETTSTTHMIIKATTPPTLASSGCIKINNLRITVPVGSLEAYQTATNWSEFADKMEEATQ